MTPLVVLLGASLIFHEKITRLSLALVGLGFAGALLVAQPSGEGISIYAVLALANAVLCAVRDLIGRRIDVEVPGLVVAISAAFIVFLVAGASHALFEQWAMPEPRHLLLMAGSGFFLMFGHFFLFMAYRVGSTGTVAPFYYS
ncbi:EamA/RhaT family transporter, partial [Rhizobiaceae sp. 2RAB30]